MSFHIFETEDALLADAKRLLESGELQGQAASAYQELAEAYEKLLQTTKRLVRLSDKSQQKLNEQAKELQKAAELREDVERIMRHDLKSPLTGLIGLPQLLLMDDNLYDSQREILQHIEKSGYKLLDMINLSTTLFKMERGIYQLAPQTMDIACVVRKLFTSFKEAAAKQRIPFKLFIQGEEDSPEATVLINAEELLCHSMLANLISNALEASPNKEPVAVFLDTTSEGGTRISIRNSGEVPLEVQNKFFEKYATAGKLKGTGLGTYSARLIALAHGGDITMESRQGLVTVSVTLPAL